MKNLHFMFSFFQNNGICFNEECFTYRIFKFDRIILFNKMEIYLEKIFRSKKETYDLLLHIYTTVLLNSHCKLSCFHIHR